MRYYIIAGEASGDLHGSKLIGEIIKADGMADIRCWGGDLMKEAGATLVKHYRDLAFMGFLEVIANLPAIMRNFRFCKADIENFQPDVLVLIDYPGFNLRMAKWAKNRGIRVVYYISPQVWAWKESRVKGIRDNVDRMIVILPFEKQFYKRWNYDVEYVGHPLVEIVDQARDELAEIPPASDSPLNEKNIIALLPGSRRQEIAAKLPIMLEASKFFPNYRFIIAKSNSIEDEFYKPFIEKYGNVRSIRRKTYPLLLKAKAALVTSGTATLETALFEVPQVVCYKGSGVSYQIAKRLIKVKYISLVNLIMDRMVVKELIQQELTVSNIRTELEKILHDQQTLLRIHADYRELKRILKMEGSPAARAAKIIVQEAMSKKRNSAVAI